MSPLLVVPVCRDFMQVFSTVHLLQLPSSRWTAATAVSGWSGAFAAEFSATQQEQHSSSFSSSMQPLLPDSIQGAGPLQDEAQADASGQSAGACSPTREQQQSQQQTRTHNARQQCRQVAPECLSWAARPQFRLVAAATCEVVLTLQQQEQCLTAKVSKNTHQLGCHLTRLARCLYCSRTVLKCLQAHRAHSRACNTDPANRGCFCIDEVVLHACASAAMALLPLRGAPSNTRSSV